MSTQSKSSDFLNEPHPEAEHHSVEEVFENVGMQEVKPLGVKLDEKRYGRYSQDVEGIDTNPAKENEPGFVAPAAYRS